MSSIRKLTMTGLAMLSAVTGCCAVGVQPALAAHYKSLAPFAVAAPRGVAVEAGTGNVFVVDNTDKLVREFSGEGVAIGSGFGGAGTAPGEFGTNNIWGVAVDSSASVCKGDVYVNAGGAEIDRFAPGATPGEYTFAAPQLQAEANTRSLAVDVSGNLYAGLWNYSSTGADEFACGSTTPTVIDKDEEKLPLTSGIAVDPAGDVYFVTGNGNVVKFNAEGELQSDPELENEAEGATAVAVDPETSEVFVVDSSPEYHVTRYSSTGVKLEAFGAGEIGTSIGIAYSPVNKEIYVTDETKEEVHVYAKTSGGGGKAPEVECKEAVKKVTTTSVTVACEIDPEGEATKWQFEYEEKGKGPFQKAPATPGSISTEGEVEETITGLTPQKEYVYRLIASNKHGLTKSPEEPFETLPAVEGVTTCAASPVAGEGATLKASLQPKGAKVEYHFQYGTSTSYGSETEVQKSESASVVSASQAIQGLEPNRAYDCRLVASDAEGVTDGPNGTFTTMGLPPGIVSELATDVESGSAQLEATIDPENSASTYYMEYVEAARYQPESADPYAEGVRTPTPEGAVGSDLSYHAIAQVLQGLAPGTTYDFRVVATNSPEPGTGTSYGEDQTFTTPAISAPVVVTGAASAVSQTGATLSGTVNPEGYATSYVFEVGSSTEYGTDISGALSGAGTEAQSVTLALANLAPLTTYHYRLVATNANGTSYGADQTFTTPGTTYSLTLPPTAPLIAIPAIVFPTGNQANTGTTVTKKLTRAQKLAKALKTCRMKKKGKRAGCEKRARKEYAPAKAGAKRKHNNQSH
jgi:phosphodiesterase/alkaline phosphatase D-like protein